MKNMRKHSELVDSAVDRIERGQDTLASFLDQYPDSAEELRREIEAALWLRSHQAAVSARAGFLASSRTHLVETLRANLAVSSSTGPIRRRTNTTPRKHLLDILSLMMLVLCIIFVSHNLVLMSELSLPGEPLYQVKLFIEQVQLAFTFDPQNEALLQVQLSQRRTTEIIELILNENYSAVPRAADRLSHQLQDSIATLGEIEKRNPSESHALSQGYQKTLSTESMILSILLETYPPEAKQYIETALQITQQGLAALQD